MAVRPGGEKCARCASVAAYSDMVRVAVIGRKRLVWLHPDCADRWRQIRRIRAK